MDTIAVVLEAPEQLSLSRLDLLPPGQDDVVVDVEFSGISTGTERLLYTGRMPPFPGMGYPLVPGYESVGRIVAAGSAARHRIGERVFVPGSRGFAPRGGVEVRGLFGGAASRLVVPAARATPVEEDLGADAVLMALAATAQHAIAPLGAEGFVAPELIVGHGVLGRLIARLVIAAGAPAPTVWETNPERFAGAKGYAVIRAEDDPRRDYRSICDVSGQGAMLDTLIGRLAPMGEVILAGFYSAPLSFAFPPAFMREARLRIAAEFKPQDLVVVREHLSAGRLSLDGLITHCRTPDATEGAYRTAFSDASCLKMVIDWRTAG